MSEAETASRLGSHLKQARNSKKLSLLQLSKIALVPKSTIGHIENGTIRRPRIEVLQALAKALELPVGDLYLLADHYPPDLLPEFPSYVASRHPELTAESINQLERHLRRFIQQDRSTPEPVRVHIDP